GALGGGGGVVLAVTLVALAAVAIWFAREPARPYLWLGAGLLAGGAIGNLADRIRLGSVTDYLDPPLWPAFNLADATITAGAIVLVLVSLSPRPEGEATGSARRWRHSRGSSTPPSPCPLGTSRRGSWSTPRPASAGRPSWTSSAGFWAAATPDGRGSSTGSTAIPRD